MNRRELLVAGSIAAVAGCLGGGATTVGRSQEVDGVALVVEDALLANELETGDGRRLLPESDRRFALVKIESTNVGDDPADLPVSGELQLIADDDQYRPIDESEFADDASGAAVSSYAHPIEGEKYVSVDGARSDASTSGWIAFHVPAETDAARLSWTRGSEQDEPRQWEISFDPGDLANIVVRGLTTPATAERHAEVAVEIELENRGGSTGEFDRSISIAPTGGTVALEASLEPGERRTYVVGIEYPMTQGEPVDEATFELAGRETTVDYEIPVRELEEAYTSPEGLSVTVSEYMTPESVEREASFGPIEHEADAGEQLLLLELAVDNGDDAERTPPGDGNWGIVDEEGNVRTAVVDFVHPYTTNDFTEPIDGDAYVHVPLEPGESRRGWLLLTVDAGISLRESKVRWERSLSRVDFDADEPRGIAAEWTL